MKIVHIILTSSFAGSERYAVDLANLQAEAGHDVHLILHRRGCQNPVSPIAPRVASDVTIHRVHGIPPIAKWMTRRIIKQLQPDVAHAHLSHACKALHPLKGVCPRVATLHIHYKPHQHKVLDGLIAIAPWQLAQMPETIKEKSTQIDNWIAPRIHDSQARARIRASIGVQDDEILIGTLGRVEESKDQINLVRSFQRAGIPGTKLAILGNGSMLPKLKKIAGRDVAFPGYVSNSREWLSAFDLFVSTAKSEPFGLVFLEAMQVGLPIIATRSQGALYINDRQQKSGSATFIQPLLPIGDSLALQSALIQQVKRFRREGKQTLDYGMEKYSPTTSIAKIEAFYRTLM